MKPIYFPFTCISDVSAQAISESFGQTVIYRPSSQNFSESMQKMAEKGILDIRIPLNDDADRFKTIIKNYKSWLSLHIDDKQGMTSFFKTQADNIPFFDETLTTRIRADIKNKIQKKKPEKKLDTVLNARIFLQIAQEFDTQNLEINQNLSIIEKMQQELIDNIKGNLNEPSVKNAGQKVSSFYDPGSYMTAKRIKAWSLLMLHDKYDSGLFITDSRSVFEYLLDKTSHTEIMADSVLIRPADVKTENSDKRHSGFIQKLEAAAKNTWTSSEAEAFEPYSDENINTKTKITIAVIPEKTPYEFFAGYSEYENLKLQHDPLFKNTLLGLVEAGD